jgi:hypothetical protein
MNHYLTVHKTETLKPGFKGKTCSFEFREEADRAPTAQKRYKDLEKHLLEHGMKNPLITYKGHVLIGQRRFMILKNVQTSFKCVELLEDVENFTTPDLVRLNNFNTKLCGDEVPRF